MMVSFKTKQEQTPKKRFDWDLFFRIASVAATLVTVWVGIQQYRENVEREFRKNFYERQMVVYNELMDVCSKIAGKSPDSIDTPSFCELEAKLNENYYGKLSLFQNVEVDNTAYDFLLTLDRFKRDDPMVTNQVMKKKCHQISQACRRSLADTYKMRLKELEYSIEDSSNKKSIDSLAFASLNR